MVFKEMKRNTAHAITTHFWTGSIGINDVHANATGGSINLAEQQNTIRAYSCPALTHLHGKVLGDFTFDKDEIVSGPFVFIK